MRLLVDTGVFSASLSRRRRPRFETQIGLMAGHQIFLAAITVSELRYGALVAVYVVLAAATFWVVRKIARTPFDDDIAALEHGPPPEAAAPATKEGGD